MRILGIDPGSTITGYGVVEVRTEAQAGIAANGVRHVAHGTISGRRGEELADRLARIHRELADVVLSHRPDVAVVERVFVAANARSALVLGQARGAALAAVAGAGVSIGELSASQIKSAVVGTGNATKAQVKAMVTRLLALPEAPPTDAADALAAAVCRAHQGALADLDVRRGRGRGRRGRASGASFVVRRAR
ncbi:MAG: crossover junction endodeoxyribonuclease RuvC [Myxococcota bacterium]|nr:crossover junction endodeoxyribonuclease RuvC [Myxococcota bacterium]